jgi:hypothetical protein
VHLKKAIEQRAPITFFDQDDTGERTTLSRSHNSVSLEVTLQ